MVDGVVKRQKGVRLGSERRYGAYEAEGVGEILAMESLAEERDAEIAGTVPLGLDNTSALHATADAKTGTGRYIWDLFHRTLRATQTTHPNFSLRPDWTPGHVDIPGNEAADEAAKRAALDGTFGGATAVRLVLPYSKSALVLTHGMLTAELPRKHASLLSQLRYHHVPLARHLYRLKKSPSSNCPCCEMADDTVVHYLSFCPAHEDATRVLYMMPAPGIGT